MRQQEPSAEIWFMIRLIINVNMQEHWHLSFVLLIKHSSSSSWEKILRVSSKIDHLDRSSFSSGREKKREREKKEKREAEATKGEARSRSHLQTLPESLLSSLPPRSKWFFLFRRMMEFHTFLRLIANIPPRFSRQRSRVLLHRRILGIKRG